jgi:oligoendopeptidase F
MADTAFGAALSFFDPELQAVPAAVRSAVGWLPTDSQDYRVYLEKLLRMKPHILSVKEEERHPVSLLGEAADTPDKAFTGLTDADMDFGTISVNGNERPLTQSTWSVFMDNSDRSVREKAYKQFYHAFESHQNTLAALYAGSVNQDVFFMRARGYKSCLEKALYRDNVPVSVYRNLIDTVHRNLPALHRYYTLRRKVLGLSELRHYDVYVPLVKDMRYTITPYDEAVEICPAARLHRSAPNTPTGSAAGSRAAGSTDTKTRENAAARSQAACYTGISVHSAELQG